MATKGKQIKIWKEHVFFSHFNILFDIREVAQEEKSREEIRDITEEFLPHGNLRKWGRIY